ncbi:MAG: hypothetical protein V4672_07905 [Verrucomicrobiota bacterium]
MKKLFCALSFLVAVNASAQTPAPSQQAELNRSTAGRTLNDRNLADGTMPLKKGMVFDVVEQKMGYVVISANGRKVVVAQTDVTVTAKPEAPASTTISPATAASAFTPGQIVLISAKYTLQGNQPRNVKNRLAKLIPGGIINQPVEILVTDDLSSAASIQGNTVTVRSGGSGGIVVTGTARNILTVEYSFNGEVRKKQAAEGTYLTLP